MPPTSSLKKPWRSLVRYVQRRRLWYRHAKLVAYRQILPGHESLTDDEIDMLGHLYQASGFRVFEKYLDLSRRQFVDNGFPVARDMMEVGEVKGNLNMCNLIETDMIGFNEAMQERAKLKTMGSTLAKEEEEDQDEDIV